MAQTVPPSPNPARRNSRVGLRKLPAEGRPGAPPDWPLSGKPNAAERKAWADLWATPQAAAWEELGWVRTVGRYCRVMLEAEKRDAPAKAMMEARQLEDRLGLTPKAMRLLLWTIVEDELGEARQERQASSGTRQRPRAVDSGG